MGMLHSNPRLSSFIDRTRRLLLEHLKKFPVSASGGLMLAKYAGYFNTAHQTTDFPSCPQGP